MLYLVGLSLLFWSTYSNIRDERVSIGGDNADYYILARSIATGHGYSYIASPEAPPGNHFPPGYPLILAACMKLGMEELPTLTAVNGVFLWGALVLFFLLFTRWGGNTELAALATALCILNAHLLQYATLMMSEVPYLFFFALALAAYALLQDAASRPRAWLPWMVVLALACVSMLYIRTAGIAVVLALCGHLLWRKRWLQAGILAGVVLASQLPWQLRSHALGGNPYMQQLLSVNPYRTELGRMTAAQWPHRVLHNGQRYVFREIPSSLLPWTDKMSRSPLQRGKEWPWPLVLLPLMAVGLWAMARDRLPVTVLLFLSFCILMAWPEVWVGVRFILPLVPVLVFLCWNGLFAVTRLAVRRLRRAPAWAPWLVVGPAAIVVAMHLHTHVLLEGKDATRKALQELPKRRTVFSDPIGHVCYAPCVQGLHVDRSNDYRDDFRSYFKTGTWARKHLPAKDTIVVCCRKPGLFYLFAGYKVTSYAHLSDPVAFMADLQARHVTHVVVDQLGFADEQRYLVPVVQSDPLKFPVLHVEKSQEQKDRNTFLLGFRPDLGYSGPWVNGRKQGKGTMRYADGMRFTGVFVNDTINGPGRLVKPDGTLWEGQWHAGRLNGWGRYTKPGTAPQEGWWHEGHLEVRSKLSPQALAAMQVP